MNIKVCGMTSGKQVNQLEGMNIDFAGFIFDKNSPRYVGDKIKGDEVAESDFDLKKVGVFVDAPIEEILHVIDDFVLDVVQLHGDETPLFCEELSEEIEVIKVFKLTPGEEVDIDELVADYDDCCDYYLFDTSGENPGGNGKKFDWNILKNAKIEKPFFISGGIEVADAAALKAFKHPDFFGVDINSKFEKEPGVKDMAKVLQFKLALK